MERYGLRNKADEAVRIAPGYKDTIIVEGWIQLPAKSNAVCIQSFQGHLQPYLHMFVLPPTSGQSSYASPQPEIIGSLAVFEYFVVPLPEPTTSIARTVL